MANPLSAPIAYLKGIGPIKAELLNKELSIYTFDDLLHHFPLRHIDKSTLSAINTIVPATEYIQIKGKILSIEEIGTQRSKRLIADFSDETGTIELVWFQSINWIKKNIDLHTDYLVFGKLSYFNYQYQIVHPEIEIYQEQKPALSFSPIYPCTEKLKSRGITGKIIAQYMQQLWSQLNPKDLPEILPAALIEKYQLLSRFEAYKAIHFPQNLEAYNQAVYRLKFEELLLSQLKIQRLKFNRHRLSNGIVFAKAGGYVHEFYNKYLPFELTNAQKRVIKEIRQDTLNGMQMNRLLQGDVGSGKTMVALFAMLFAVENGYQTCMMAPTEILAQQHFKSIQTYLKDLPITVKLLTGSTPSKERKKILEGLQQQTIDIIIGTHAIIENKVQFKNFGLAIIDEQHRFGVAQRAALWEKNSQAPHVLVMTATPIPRTLAMTAYGDLDYSVIDELPPGRKSVKTIHKNEMLRHRVMEFIKKEIQEGRQVYIVYPLIEESEFFGYEDLMQGYEQVKSYFPPASYNIAMLHGRQSLEEKENNMQKFMSGEAQILVSTTVIEVGVNNPNASVMVIESSEKFGLSQLHQLRGRVGRGNEQSYCILLSGQKLSAEAKERLNIMCLTNDGFKIAEKDLALRGPGDIQGTRQSGALNFKLANLIEDKSIVEICKNEAAEILQTDLNLVTPAFQGLKKHLSTEKDQPIWGNIS